MLEYTTFSVVEDDLSEEAALIAVVEYARVSIDTTYLHFVTLEFCPPCSSPLLCVRHFYQVVFGIHFR